MGTAKYINALQAAYSYMLSSALRKPFIYGFPPAIGIELTNHCNLHCPECLSGNGTITRQKGFMKEELFRKIVDELRPYLYNINLYFQGEPMLHPAFFKLIETAVPIKTTVSTNGHFLNPENCEKLATSGLTRIIISLDGFDQDTYGVYRVNGDFEKVRDGIIKLSQAVREYRSSLKMIIQVLVNRYNEDQIAQIREFAKETSAQMELKSMQVYNEKETWLPSSESFRRYELQNGDYRIKGRLPRVCRRLWFNPVVTWDGKVLPCCFDKDADHILGDLNFETFREVWNGKMYNEFRLKLIRSGERIDMCNNCTSGLAGVKV